MLMDIIRNWLLPAISATKQKKNRLELKTCDFKVCQKTFVLLIYVSQLQLLLCFMF